MVTTEELKRIFLFRKVPEPVLGLVAEAAEAPVEAIALPLTRHDDGIA